MNTLLLDTTTWDLVLDANSNIAVAEESYSLAQDAASYIKTFLGEVYWDTTLGIPYLTAILGKNPPLGLVKQQLENAALQVPDVASATCIISSFTDRIVAGQVQVISLSTGQASVASFSTINPQEE